MDVIRVPGRSAGDGGMTVVRGPTAARAFLETRAPYILFPPVRCKHLRWAVPRLTSAPSSGKPVARGAKGGLRSHFQRRMCLSGRSIQVTQDFSKRLDEAAARTQAMLAALLDDAPGPGEIARPARLMQAMRHAALNGGKRLRPFLLVEAARLFGRDDDGVIRAAAALECVHCYSLVHDDLPAMDDDDMRRGKPTVHVAFDEATAILAGDALLTYAFDVLADPATDGDAGLRADLVLALARASGHGGMAGGQMFDLAAEGQILDEDEIRRLQSMKTGALIRYAAWAGARMAGAAADDIARLTRFGEIAGLAFQLADDLLDVEGEAAAVGKATGKDAERGKATLVALKGADWTRAALKSLVAEAEGLLQAYGARATTLRQAAHFIAERRT